MIGLFEPVCAPWKVGGVPEDFSFGEITPDWDRMGPYVEKAMRARARSRWRPACASSSAARRASRPISRRSSARRRSCKNYFVAAGLNSIGILTGGGLGRVLAHWIVNGPARRRRHRHQHRPPAHLPDQPRVPRARARSSRSAWSTSATTRRARCRRRAARSARRSTIGSPRAGAYFRDVSGWEGADWYAPPGRRAGAGPAVVGAAAAGSRTGQAEHRADARGRHPHGHVVHVEVPRRRGATPGGCSNCISANHVDGDAGRHHVHAVAQRGRQARGRPHGHQARRRALLGGRVGHRAPPRRDLDAPPHRRRRARVRHRRDLGLRADQRPGAALARADAVGHRRRTCRTRRSRSATAREIDIGFARVLCVRITYLGELGYELYVPTEQARARLRPRSSRPGEPRRPAARGAARRSRACAWRRATATTATTSTTPTRCSRPGSGFAVDLKKPGGFLGQDAVLAKKAAGPLTRRLVQILVKDPEPLMFHAEVVRRDGGRSGYVRAASYGFTARRRGRPGDGRGRRRAARPGAGSTRARWEVEIAGKRLSRDRVAAAAVRPEERARPRLRGHVTFTASPQAGASARAGASHRLGRAGRTRRSTTGGDQP